MIKPAALVLILAYDLQIASVNDNKNKFVLDTNIVKEQVSNKSTIEYNYITTQDYLKENIQRTLENMIRDSLAE